MEGDFQEFSNRIFQSARTQVGESEENTWDMEIVKQMSSETFAKGCRGQGFGRIDLSKEVLSSEDVGGPYQEISGQWMKLDGEKTGEATNKQSKHIYTML